MKPWDGKRAVLVQPGTGRLLCAECRRWFWKLARAIDHINKAHL